MTIRDKELAALLEHEWLFLKQSSDTLDLSFIKCNAIGIREQYTFEEQELDPIGFTMNLMIC